MALTAIAGIVGFVEHHGMMAVRGEGAKKKKNGSCRFMGTEFQL